MKWIFGILALVILLAVFAGGLVVGSAADWLDGLEAGGIGLQAASGPESDPVLSFLIPVAYLAISVLVLATVILLVVAVLAGLIRLWRKVRDVFGTSAPARLIGLGLVAIPFPGAVRWIVVQPIRTLLAPLSWLPQKFVEIWETRADACRIVEAETLGACVSSLGAQMLHATAAPFTDIRDSVTYAAPLQGVLLGLALWAILGNLVSGLVGDQTNLGQGLSQSVRRLSFAGWMNISLFAILGLGGYLSMAAITAIPLLGETAAEGDLRLDDVRADLEAILGKERFGNAFAEEIDVGDPEKPINDYLDQFQTQQTPQDGADADDSEPDEEHIEQSLPEELKGYLVQLAATLGNEQSLLMERWDATRLAAEGQLERLSTDADGQVELIDLALSPARDKLKSLADLRRWAQSEADRVISNTRYCRLDIERATAWLTSGAERIVAEVKDDLARDPDMRLLRNPAFLFGSFDQQFSRSQACEFIDSTGRPLPGQVKPALGAFAFVRWLTKLESTPLALITGLIGFGLLGSAVSSFVRERPKRKEGEPLVSDLPRVLIRGLTAAFVVYLAVKGGLAMFSLSSDEQPNPYVLLLTCLVAAVFSEDVWVAARKRLRSRLGSGRDDGGGGVGGGAGGGDGSDGGGEGGGDGGQVNPPSNEEPQKPEADQTPTGGAGLVNADEKPPVETDDS